MLYTIRFAVVLAVAALSLPLVAQEESPTALEAPDADGGRAMELEMLGTAVTPHVRAGGLRFSDPGVEEGPLGARIQFFVQNTAADSENEITLNTVSFDRTFPLLEMLDGNWSWADTPNEWPGHERRLPAGAMMVWTINAVHPTWDGDSMSVSVVDWSRSGGARMDASVAAPERWMSAVTFLGESPNPTRMIVHIDNESDTAIRLTGARLWLPKDRAKYRVLFPQAPLENVVYFPADGTVAPGDKAILTADTPALPLTYAAVEVSYMDSNGEPKRLWGHVRIKREVFDIAGGWVGGRAADGKNTLQHEPFLKTLKRLYVNAGHIGVVPGYNNSIGSGGLYDQYPIKFFGHFPVDQYDTPELSAHVHGVEILGEPQLPFGGELPQTCYKELLPYRKTRIPSTLTLSDERTMRHYAGISDYPHYDAYRVIAPSADSWRRYDRWGGERISWGAPLETIGDLSRVVREMSRPMPTAVWSQGPHEGWYEIDGRTRLSPTPDELRVQAYHALSSRVTSMYWFNLSLKSLVQFRDTLEPMTRIGREIRILEKFYLKGDAYEYKRILKSGGGPDWDLASIAAPEGAVLFALDLDYTPDDEAKVFKFGEPRPAEFHFKLPPWLRDASDVFRIDAGGVYNVDYAISDGIVTIRDTQNKVAIYVATPHAELRDTLNERREALILKENAIAFNPAEDDGEFAELKALAN